MAQNPPQAQKREILGLPLWAWGLGLAAFLIGVIVIFRQQGSSAGTSSAAGYPSGSTTATGYGVPVPYPVPTSAAPVQTNSQAFGQAVLTARPGYKNNAVTVWGAPTTASAKLSDLPSGSTLPETANVVTGQDITIQGVESAQWQPVLYNQQTGYVWAPDVVTMPQNTVGINSNTLPGAVA